MPVCFPCNPTLHPLQRGGFPLDRSAVAEAVLRKESLMQELYRNYRRLLGLAGERGAGGPGFPSGLGLLRVGAAPHLSLLHPIFFS